MITDKNLTLIASILGAVFILLAYVYWFMSGNAPSHFVHGLIEFVIGAALFAFAWFKSRKKSL